MSKFKETMKGLGKSIKASAKKNPKLFGTIVAAIIVATGGSAGTAVGIIEVAGILDAVGSTVGAMTSQ